MGAAAYNRGTGVVAREADVKMAGAHTLADRRAAAEERTRLRAQIARLERDLARARRCLAGEREGRERLRLALISERSSRSMVETLGRAARDARWPGWCDPERCLCGRCDSPAQNAEPPYPGG